MARTPIPMPLSDPISTPRNPRAKPGQKDPGEGILSPEWVPYFTDQGETVSSVSQIVSPMVELTAQAASIVSTPIPTTTLAGGYYRVSFYARVTTAAATSSSLIVTLSWTDGGVSCGISSVAVTGNLTSTVATGTAVIEIDQATGIAYSTTYASVGVPAMQYKLTVILESL